MPAEQTVHAEAVPTEYRPVEHELQLDLPVEDAYVPAWQAVQALLLEDDE